MDAFLGGILQTEPLASQNPLFAHAHNILLFSLNQFLCSCRYAHTNGLSIFLLLITGSLFLILNTKLEQKLEIFWQGTLRLREVLLNNCVLANCGFLVFLITQLGSLFSTAKLNFTVFILCYNIIRKCIIIRQISKTSQGFRHRIKAFLRGKELPGQKYFALLCSQLNFLILQMKRSMCHYLILMTWCT